MEMKLRLCTAVMHNSGVARTDAGGKQVALKRFTTGERQALRQPYMGLCDRGSAWPLAATDYRMLRTPGRRPVEAGSRNHRAAGCQCLGERGGGGRKQNGIATQAKLIQHHDLGGEGTDGFDIIKALHNNGDYQ